MPVQYAWAVSVAAIRDTEETDADGEIRQCLSVMHEVHFFWGPHIEYVEAQAELKAREQWPDYIEYSVCAKRIPEEALVRLIR